MRVVIESHSAKLAHRHDRAERGMVGRSASTAADRADRTCLNSARSSSSRKFLMVQNAVMSQDVPDRLLSSDGETGWYAFPPEGYDPGADDEAWEGPPVGSLIRLMAEDSVDVPLWGPAGLIFMDGEELINEWGISDQLAKDIVRWGRASSRGLQNSELDADAARLVRALTDQTGHRFRIVHHP